MEPENVWSFDNLLPETELEGCFNTGRDCSEYVDIYNIHDATTIIRGELRYKVPPCNNVVPV